MKKNKKDIINRKIINEEFKEFCNSTVCKYCKYAYKHTPRHPGGDGQCKAAFILDNYDLVKKG